MAIKNAAEMFGDGSGGNPQVPIDTGEPPGFNVLNRGVAFGEQVTSAIKNRTPYALVLNDEDLNTRLSDFEVGGLDSAYDLGTIGPAGGGRTITKDAGAVETVSALSAQYEDDIANAHFRANLSGDGQAGGVGFDAVRTAQGTASFLDRWTLDEGGDTQWSPGDAATLNPASGGGDRVRLDAGQQFRGGGNTEILLGDLMLIQGTSSDGLYYINSIVDDITVTVRTLSGGTPSFTADETGTITGYRPRFTSADFRRPNDGVVVKGINSDFAALTIMAGPGNGAGADSGLAFRQTLADGAPDGTIFSYFTDVGGFRYSAHPGDVPGTDEQNFEAAAVLLDWRTNPGAPGLGIISPGREDNLSTSLNFFQTELVTDLGTVARAGTIANDDELTITGIAGNDIHLPVIGTIIQVISPLGDAGYYRVTSKPAADTYLLRDLAGNQVFLTNGAATVRMYRGTFLGQGITYTLGIAWRDDLSVPSHNDDVRTTAVFPAADGDGGSSICLVSAQNGAGGNNKYFIRGIAAATESGGQEDAETFQVTAGGDIEGMGAMSMELDIISENGDLRSANGGVFAEPEFSNGGFGFGARTTAFRQTQGQWTSPWRGSVDATILTGQLKGWIGQTYISGGTGISMASASNFARRIYSFYLVGDADALVRDSIEFGAINIIWAPGAVHGGSRTAGNRLQATLRRIVIDNDAGGGYALPTITDLAVVEQTSTTSRELVAINVSEEPTDLTVCYELEIRAAADGATNRDRIYGIKANPSIRFLRQPGI